MITSFMTITMPNGFPIVIIQGGVFRHNNVISGIGPSASNIITATDDGNQTNNKKGDKPFLEKYYERYMRPRTLDDQSII